MLPPFFVNHVTLYIFTLLTDHIWKDLRQWLIHRTTRVVSVWGMSISQEGK